MATARLIREDELEQLLALYGMLHPDDPDPDPETLQAQWETMLAADRVEIVVVEHDDRLVSTCVLSITPNLTRGGRPFGLLENVVTHEDYRGQGFGTKCLQETTDIAEDRGCYKVMLLTGRDSQHVHDFYQQCGFDRDAKTGYVKDLRE